MTASSVSLHNTHPVTRLTALWALNESGLGGLMFALKIPLTGFFVGGFAVLLIGLIAFYSRYDYKKILRATLLVLIIKATVSPHAPPPAYLAVAFQGCLGALLYGVMKQYRLASVLLAVIAMVESALQKLIILTLIYGKSIWQALDQLGQGIRNELGLVGGTGFSYWVIGTYLLLYVIWGLCIGFFAAGLPHRISKEQEMVLSLYKAQQPVYMSLPPSKHTRKNLLRWLMPFLLLVLIVSIFLFSDNNSNFRIGFILLRSLAAIMLIFYLLRPVATWLIQSWLKRRNAGTQAEATALLELMPSLRNFVGPSWQLAGGTKGHGSRLGRFVVYLVILSLHEK